MSQPSMAEAAKIRDVAARHAYVFDNGLSSPDFLDLEKRMQSEEFDVLWGRVDDNDSVLEVGCFTGLNLLGLSALGHKGKLQGVDFVRGAVDWMLSHPLGNGIGASYCDFASFTGKGFNTVICFDVLEHQLNVGDFLSRIRRVMTTIESQALFLVPIGKEYYDCGHVAFFPDAECLRNVLEYYFEVEELFELKTCRKMFASCRRRESIPGIPKKQEPIRATAVDRVTESLADGHLE